MNLINTKNNEEWYATYANNPEIYNLFSMCEDYENKALKKLFNHVSFQDKIVLDIGCGSGKYIALIAPLCKRYYALDKSQEILDLAKKLNKNLNNVYYINANSSDIPLNDNSVEIVFSSWGLSMQFIDQTMKEIERVLIPGGEMWAFGNHPSGEFMMLRGQTQIDKDRSTMEILDNKYCLNVKEIVKTNFVFDSEEMAQKIFKHLFKDNAVEYIKNNNVKELGHNILIQHKKNET